MAAKESDIQTQITLHYIDKLFASRQRLAQGAQRFLLTATVLALIVLTISGGAASTERALSISGISLQVPLTVFLTFGAVVVGVLNVAGVTGLSQAELLDKEIQRLYWTIEFDDQTLHARIASPFRSENAVMGLISTFLKEDYQYGESKGEESWYSVIKAESLELLLFLIIPTAAQVGAGFKVSEILQQAGLGWVWIFFALFAVGTSILLLAYPAPETNVPPEINGRPPTEVADSRFRVWLVITGILAFGVVFALPGIAVGFFVAKGLGHLLAC